MLLIYELVQLVGPGARKPSVGEGIECRRPLNQLQSSLFIAFFPSYFHNFFVPILVCEIIIIASFIVDSCRDQRFSLEMWDSRRTIAWGRCTDQFGIN